MNRPSQQPISTRSATVLVEYDYVVFVAGQRTVERRRTKPLPAIKARSVYLRKDREGKNPRIYNAES